MSVEKIVWDELRPLNSYVQPTGWPTVEFGGYINRRNAIVYGNLLGGIRAQRIQYTGWNVCTKYKGSGSNAITDGNLNISSAVWKKVKTWLRNIQRCYALRSTIHAVYVYSMSYSSIYLNSSYRLNRVLQCLTFKLTGNDLSSVRLSITLEAV